MERPFPAYAGNESYVFVCYSHEDAELVYPEISWLRENGVNIWYDEGIPPAREFPAELARAIENAGHVLFYVTPRSVARRYCRNEVYFALEHGVSVVASHLEATQIPPGLELTTGSIQALLRHEIPVADYRKKLLAVLTETGGASTPAAASRRSRTSRKTALFGTRSRWAAVAMVVAAALGAAWWFYGPGQGPAPIRSIAVLPLENLSGDPKQEYFADGMTDTLIGDLSTISALRVISRTSVMQYKHARKTLPEIARELHVDSIVEGSVLQDAGRVRIAARLIDGRNDAQLWAESFERDLGGVLELQSSLARTIAGEINVALTPQERNRLVKRPVNPKTYDAYLKGMFYVSQQTDEGIEKGLAYMRKAIEEDPQDPLAYGEMALIYNQAGHGPGALPDAFKRGHEAALHALELDPQQPEAQFAMAEYYKYYEWNWPKAEQAYQRALQLNPNSALAHGFYAVFQAGKGRWEEAFAELRLAEQLDPLNSIYPAWLGWMYWSAGRYDDAIAEAKKNLELEPDSPWGFHVLGNAYSSMGRHEEAIATQKKAAERSPRWEWGLGMAYAMAGRKDEAHAVAEKMKEMNQVDCWGLGEIYAQLGEPDEAVDWLEVCYKTRRDWMADIPAERGFEPLYGFPRFRALMRRMKFPQDLHLPKPTWSPPGATTAKR